MLDFIERVEAFENDVDLTLPRVDVTRGVFITSRGDEIQLSPRPITSLMLERVTNQGKPRIPQKEVNIMGKHKQLEANEQDPGYLALLKEWQDNQNVRVMRYIFTVGTNATPPEEFIAAQAEFFPDATETDLKYLYVASLIPDSDIEKFTEAVLGQSMPTEKGLQAAANSFQSE